MKIILEKVVDFIESDDGGQAKIIEIDSDEADVFIKNNSIIEDESLSSEDGFFVRIQSWYSSQKDKILTHPVIDALEGKRIRVTIEVIDE